MIKHLIWRRFSKEDVRILKKINRSRKKGDKRWLSTETFQQIFG